MRPVSFHGRLGWLHTPVGGTSDVGVVLVSPIGRDARCAHMPMRLLADRLAAAGFCTIRYDHLGVGDSLDLPDEADVYPEWLQGISHATEFLRATTGVNRVVLGGVRMGATFAAISAVPSDGLILLAPVLSGRSWLNRMRFSARMSKTPDGAGGAAESIDTDGLWLSPATVASLSRVDLNSIAPPQGPVFIAAQNQLVKAYAERASKAGAMVHATDFPGFNEMFLDSAVNLPPDDLFDSVRAWLFDTFGQATPLAAPGRPSDECVLRPPGSVERAVAFGPGLHGVLCRPETAGASGPAVLFCNTGGDPRAGSGGFASKAARRLANMGLTSLRFDMAGLGDSPMPDGAVRCHVFETPREGDIDAALAFLGEHGYGRVVVVGVCSGAYHALRAAWRNPRVSGLFAVSPIKMIWRPGDSATFARDEYLFSVRVYVKALLDPNAWSFAIQSRTSFLGLLLALANRLKTRLLGMFARLGPSSPLANMRRFTERGGRVRLVMGLNDTSLEEVETYFGSKSSKLRRLEGASIEIIPNLDHGLARRASRDIAVELLANWLASFPTPSA
jgi:pimeloyl-ACP methyl ester carboxylesterase